MRPAILCKLKKGKALAAHQGFVDTFNWLVDFCSNLKGDGDVDRNKAITVDKTIDDRPVIKAKGGSGGANGDGESVDILPSTISDPDGPKLEVKGFGAASGLTIPRKSTGGALEWVEGSDLVNPDGKSVETSESTGKLQLLGWDAPGGSGSLAEDLTDDAVKSYLLVVRDNVTGNLVFKPVGIPHSFKFNGTEIALVLADDDIEIDDVQLEAGDGITIEPLEDGAVLRISATAQAPSGYTVQSQTVLADVQYDTNSKSLQKRFYTERWENGILKSRTLGDWQTYHTAVEETVYVPT